MRVSEHYKLERRQSDLDFVDVDIRADTPLFVDPRALRLLRSEWGDECVALVQSFFKPVLDAIRANDRQSAIALLRGLREPNETHLGFSRGHSRGSGLGRGLAKDTYDSLVKSEAVRTSGLLEDLEDSTLMVDGIDRDRISDITTNLIREPLIHYTQDMCRHYAIKLRKDVASGALWSPSERRWTDGALVELPYARASKLLLVPKTIVRKKLDYDPGEYFNHFVLESMQQAEISANTELVYLLRDGSPRVTKKSLKEKYGHGKQLATEWTRDHPEVLDRYRERKQRRFQPPLDHDDIAQDARKDLPDWQATLNAVLSVKPGRSGADDYHKAIEALLTDLLSPDLAYPRLEQQIHAGRKRIDISYTNAAADGFFAWLSRNFSAATIVVECKNYSGDPSNPELDQLAGRFSPSRGLFGLLLCRRFEDKDLFWQRCIDTAKDTRGWIVPLDDDDLRQLVALRETHDKSAVFRFFKDRFDRLTN